MKTLTEDLVITAEHALMRDEADGFAEAQPPCDGDRDQHSRGSYGRGIYGGNSTYDVDYYTSGSYGRGFYGGHSTYDHDYDTPGSYGRGIYGGHSTYRIDFRCQGNFARGLEQPER